MASGGGVKLEPKVLAKKESDFILGRLHQAIKVDRAREEVKRNYVRGIVQGICGRSVVSKWPHEAVDPECPKKVPGKR